MKIAIRDDKKCIANEVGRFKISRHERLKMYFDGDILVKLMCVTLNKVKKVRPLIIPFIKYFCTKKEVYIKQTALCMSIIEEVLDKDT